VLKGFRKNHSLSLADEDYRWIARPVVSEEIQDEPDVNDMEIDEAVPKQKVIVCELAEIRKELLLVFVPPMKVPMIRGLGCKKMIWLTFHKRIHPATWHGNFWNDSSTTMKKRV